jgi:hypothetical protein
MYPIGYIHARNKLECMGLITEFRITTIMLILEKLQMSLLLKQDSCLASQSKCLTYDYCFRSSNILFYGIIK